MALDPKRQVKGMRFDIVKFLIFEELLRLKTGCLPAQKLKNMTPHAQMSTAEDYV